MHLVLRSRCAWFSHGMPMKYALGMFFFELFWCHRRSTNLVDWERENDREIEIEIERWRLYIHTYICIYIYRERERERDGRTDRQTDTEIWWWWLWLWWWWWWREWGWWRGGGAGGGGGFIDHLFYLFHAWCKLACMFLLLKLTHVTGCVIKGLTSLAQTVI